MGSQDAGKIGRQEEKGTTEQWTTFTMEYLTVTIEYIKNIALGREKMEKVEEEIFCW